jgi:hypothetical protein
MMTVTISWMMLMEINMTRIRMEMRVKSVYDFAIRVEMIWIMLKLRVIRRT